MIPDTPLRLLLDCSTVHLCPESVSYLELQATQQEEYISTTPYGWFMWIPDEDYEYGIPPSLTKVLQYARNLGAEYLLFDRDASSNLDLPEYPWP